MHKKGQDIGVNMAVLISLIALFMIFYIVLIPPKDRAELLGEEFLENASSESISASGEVLFEIQPGKMGPQEESTISHTLTGIDLYVRSEPEVKELLTVTEIKRNIIKNQYKIINFEVESLDNLEGATLFFLPSYTRGKLIIELNGNIVFEGILNEKELQKIILPKEYITEETNNLRISTGFSLLIPSRYVLNDIKLRNQYRLENIKESRTFVIPETEIDSIDKVKLNYFVYCNSASKKGTAQLKILLNSEIIESSSLPCISRYIEMDVNKEFLTEGTNSLSFELDKGDFRFSDIELKTDLDSKTFRKTYDFSVTKEQYSLIKRNSLDALFNLEFEGTDDELKEAELSVNSHSFNINTERDTYSREISSYLKEGSNRIRIKPLNEFEVLLLEVRLE